MYNIVMGEQAAAPGSGVPLETAATKKGQISPNHDSSIADTGAHVFVGEKHKFARKGRRKSGSKKHRAGRNQKRKYKPYHKLSFSEKKKIDDRNEKRNNRKREYLHSCGVSLAPPNTNQFLFEDRAKTGSLSRRIEGNIQNVDNNSDLSSLSEYDGSDSGSEGFLGMWQREKRQRFQNMSDQELREYFVSLEDEIAENNKRRDEGITKIRIFQEEVKSYEAANEVLSKLNAGLAKVLEDMHCKVEKDQLLENDSPSADIGTAV